jgi:hypothetical protein
MDDLKNIDAKYFDFPRRKSKLNITLDSVKAPKPVEPDVNVNLIDKLRLKLKNTLNLKEEQSMWEDLKNYIVGFLVRWIMKIGGGFLLAHGISQNSVKEIVGAVVGILIGLIISLFQHNKALNDFKAGS